MKKILFFYYNQNDCNDLNILKTVLDGFSFDATNVLNEAKEMYVNEEYHIVVVDFTQEVGKELLQFIAQTSPNQRIITMSNNLECSALQGCEFCMHTLKRKRIFKPLNLKELTHTIKNYDNMICNYMHKFNNIIQILDDLIKSTYNHFLYNKDSQKIVPKESYAESLIVEELIHITELLQNNQIPYTVDENYTIQLLPKQ
ncbi:hypothetical protein [Candidatus Marinarcus aquaticus]|uniref:Response regulatory domain-containing protein n=1 Tax=Candidatus Marinarcus aquaticus TaxID=2044504 RepID=A0A4Q0XV73_9BACT|nr:hypothetical protein [Candidatus Marinarcus aquaticus]RXJ58073.1 hypothetical protein CRV04_06075 [Candidatus Marinarcus aquaticus]